MKHIGAIILGTWYALIASISLVWAVRGLSTEPKDKHYVLLAACSLAGIAIGCAVAAAVSITHPLTVAFVTAIPFVASLIQETYPILTLSAWGERSAYLMPPLVSSWSPSIAGWVYTRLILIFLVALLAGQAVKEFHLAVSRPAVFAISWKVWLWLWVPIFFWLHPLPSNLYFVWLNLALDWHRGFHTSLWFDWKWDLFASLADIFAFAALVALLAGVHRALSALSSVVSRPRSRMATLREFLIFGLGSAVAANFFLLTLTVWAMNHIMVVTDTGKPWWQFF